MLFVICGDFNTGEETPTGADIRSAPVAQGIIHGDFKAGE